MASHLAITGSDCLGDLAGRGFRSFNVSGEKVMRLNCNRDVQVVLHWSTRSDDLFIAR
jgi:hypothetical protein